LLSVAYVLFLLQVGGQDSLDVAASYNNIAIIYRNQGKYEEALEYYQKDLDITVRLVGRPAERGHII
jgi:tetratricopeptide (TPR) repeat protein